VGINVDTTEELPTVISFCSGYAGIERGLNLAGVRHRVVAYVEIEAFAIANLVAKMEAGELAPAPIWSNLKTFPAHLFRGAVDIITGGYPCQPFSAAGKRAGADDPRHLWPFIREHVQTIKPARCFFENVEGHISLGLRDVIGDLEEDGYRSTWGIFSAEEVGAPHRRKRVFIMGDTKCEGLEGFGYDNAESQKRREEKKRPVASTDSAAKSEELADARCCTSSESEQQTKLRAAWLSESPTGPRCGMHTGADEKGQAWPSGAGPEQHEWEQPRVIWKAECKLGGAVNGYTHRVDRLRLLGNGIVPATAAKAWQVLDARFNNE
tara:strand:- start:3893 stop:4861 length:969 start_codon:yes stop_codon:yes gene_type:complete